MMEVLELGPENADWTGVYLVIIFSLVAISFYKCVFKFQISCLLNIQAINIYTATA